MMSAEIIEFPHSLAPLRQMERDLQPMFESAEAMLRQNEIDAATGKPSLNERDCRGIAQDVSIQAYAMAAERGLCPRVDMVPFWMKVAIFFPRVADGVMRVWKNEAMGAVG